MSEVKHTPGKWVACGSEDTLATWVEDGDGKRVCTMRQCEQDWQRAQLIAAVLELLEALKDACEWLDSCPLGEDQRKAVLRYRAIIAKATGKE